MKATYYEFQSEDVASGMPGYVMPLSVKFSPNGMFSMIAICYHQEILI